MTAGSKRDDQIEDNKATVKRMLASLTSGNVAGFTQSLAPNYVRHCQAMPADLQELHGRDAMHDWLTSCFTTFPDYREELEWLVGEGDFVAWRTRATGTQTGAFGPFPAMHRRMDLAVIGMHRFERGVVVETWTSWDNLAALTQLGHMGANAS